MAMKGKQQKSIINFKVILFCCFFLFLFFLITRSTSLFSNSLKYYPLIPSIHNQEAKQRDCPNIVPKCSKIPASLAHALVHYATSNITPQQTIQEISLSLKVLEKKSPCNFLVFGLGLDSLMWTSLNYGGRTVFLEEDKSWIEKIKEQNPSLESYHVVYDTKRTQAGQLYEIGMQQQCKVVSDPRVSKCQLALKVLPSTVYDTEWDVIMVDAPRGYKDWFPGRMTAIYTSGLMARNRENGETRVFVHDVNRTVEDSFSMSFLCERYFVEEKGIMRHFNVPSHRAAPSAVVRPFCP